MWGSLEKGNDGEGSAPSLHVPPTIVLAVQEESSLLIPTARDKNMVRWSTGTFSMLKKEED